MDFLSQLWIPIVVSSAAVWVIAAIIWMAMPHRKSEWSAVGDQTKFVDMLRTFELRPGNYMFPFCGSKTDMKDETLQRLLKEGPMGTIHIWRGMRPMGVCMLASFVFYLVVGVFVAYLGWHAFEGKPNPNYLHVFQITGTTAFMAYTFALIPNGIWFGKPIKSIAFDVIDGLVMGLVTGGIFGWLWPSVETVMNADVVGGMGG